MYATLMRHGMLVLCSKMFAGLIANEQYIPAESLLNILYPQQTNRTLPAVLDSCTF
jgi:hypothetical protein